MNISVLNVEVRSNSLSRVYPVLRMRNVLFVEVNVLTGFCHCPIFRRNFPLGQVLPVVAEKNAVKNHHARQKAIVAEARKRRTGNSEPN